MSEAKTIRPLEGYVHVSDADVVSRGTAVETGINGNPNFPSPPIDPAVLKAAIERLSALIAEALDGSKKVIAEKNKQREAVIKMLRLLARYVEVTCKNDMAIFKSSGFEPAPTTRTPRQQLSERIRKIDHGANSGQVLILIKADPKALSYELRYTVLGSGEKPGVWTTQLVTNVKTPITITSLVPGTTYAFQVRAMEKLGYTDWSDSATFMCT